MAARTAPPAIDEDASIVALVAAHKKRKSEPLHLAVRYEAPKQKKHILLFEVIGGFGGRTISRDETLFTVGFRTTPELRLNEGTELRLVLTSPEELEVALAARWPSLEPILKSKRANTAKILTSDDTGMRLWRKLK